MPTSGDLISGVYFFGYYTPPWMSTTPPLHRPLPQILTQPPWLKTLHVYGVLWSKCYQNLLSLLQWWNNLCQWLNTHKNVPETIQWIKTSWKGLFQKKSTPPRWKAQVFSAPPPIHLDFQNCLSPPPLRIYKFKDPPTHLDFHNIVRHRYFTSHSMWKNPLKHLDNLFIK